LHVERITVSESASVAGLPTDTPTGAMSFAVWDDTSSTPVPSLGALAPSDNLAERSVQFIGGSPD